MESNHILIIEDDMGNLVFLTELLRAEGYVIILIKVENKR